MKSQNLTQGGILKSLVTFAFPVLLALFLQVMYGAADTSSSWANSPEPASSPALPPAASSSIW